MDDSQLLFSTNTYLGLYIAQKFYHGKHYLWFASSFNDPKQPKTSDPLCRCQMMLKTVATKDTHDEFLEGIREGMERGVQTKLKEGCITEDTSLKIRKLIDVSRKEDEIRTWCMPVVLVTTWGLVKEYEKKLSADKKASSTSVEILCNNVPREAFDLINLEHIMNEYEPFRRGDV